MAPDGAVTWCEIVPLSFQPAKLYRDPAPDCGEATAIVWRLPGTQFTTAGAVSVTLSTITLSPTGEVVTVTAVVPATPETLRTRLLLVSAMYAFPELSAATPSAELLRDALVAGPPSPLYPGIPLPASVAITPPVTMRTR